MRTSIVALVAAAMLGVGAAVSCAQLAPRPTDPSAWPCGDPRMQWCPGHTGCCYSDEVCRPEGMCADNAEIPTIRAQRLVDAGADR